MIIVKGRVILLLKSKKMNISNAPAAAVSREKGLPPALWALTISAFAIGTTEFVAVGILPTIAQSLRVSVSSAGYLVSFYALGVAIGGPLLMVLTAKIPRKPLLVSLMGLFILGHIASALATDFTMLLTARFISGFAHAVFFGVGATIAARIVAPDKQASAIAFMFAGFTVAIIAGVPLGTFIGQYFGWRATFAGVALLGAVSFIAILLLIPGHITMGPPLRLKDQLQVIRTPPILIILAITAFGYGGTFVTFTLPGHPAGKDHRLHSVVCKFIIAGIRGGDCHWKCGGRQAC